MRTKPCVMALDHFGKDEEQGPPVRFINQVVQRLSTASAAIHFQSINLGSRKADRRQRVNSKLRTVKFSDGGSSFCIDWKPHGKFEGEAGGEDDPIIGGMVAAGKARRDAEARWPKPLRAFSEGQCRR